MLVFINAMTADPSDREFMSQLYLRYERLMYATAKRYVSDPEPIKDIVQESIVKLIGKISFLRGQDRCIHASYIVSTVRNTAINYLRKQSDISAHCISLEDEGEHDIVAQELSLDELMLRQEQIERLVKTWELIPEEDRLLLEGKYILGYRDIELASMLGCKESSVRMKLTRARRRALRSMSEEGDRHDEA